MNVVAPCYPAASLSFSQQVSSSPEMKLHSTVLKDAKACPALSAESHYTHSTLVLVSCTPPPSCNIVTLDNVRTLSHIRKSTLATASHVYCHPHVPYSKFSTHLRYSTPLYYRPNPYETVSPKNLHHHRFIVVLQRQTHPLPTLSSTTVPVHFVPRVHPLLTRNFSKWAL